MSATIVRGVRSNRRRVRTPLTSKRNAFLLLLPVLVLILVYKYGPIIQAMWASLNSYSVAGSPIGFVGMGNFERVLGDPAFINSLALTGAFVIIKIPLQIVLGISAAMLLRKTSAYNAFVRVTLVLPAVTPIAIIGIIFLFLFDREVGLTNAAISSLGLPRIGWLTQPGTAQLVITLASVWRDAGFTMLIYLAGLTAIPTEVLEAARVDGASGWQLTTRVILPLLQRSTQLAVVTTTIGAFQYFAPIFVLTQGGPQSATDVASFHIYQTAFVYFDQGSANAMALILVLLIIAVTAIELWLLRSRWEY